MVYVYPVKIWDCDNQTNFHNFSGNWIAIGYDLSFRSWSLNFKVMVLLTRYVHYCTFSFLHGSKTWIYARERKGRLSWDLWVCITHRNETLRLGKGIRENGPREVLYVGLWITPIHWCTSIIVYLHLKGKPNLKNTVYVKKPRDI